jgi:hypothetical protein
MAELTVTIVEEDPAVVIEGLEPYSTAAIWTTTATASFATTWGATASRS